MLSCSKDKTQHDSTSTWPCSYTVEELNTSRRSRPIQRLQGRSNCHCLQTNNHTLAQKCAIAEAMPNAHYTSLNTLAVSR